MSTPWNTADKPARGNWATPQKLFDEIQRRYAGPGGFTLDPCAEAWNAKCELWMGEDDDGLEQRWRVIGRASKAFVNPPYSNIGAWVAKAWAEVQCGNAELVVMLLPARTDRRFW